MGYPAQVTGGSGVQVSLPFTAEMLFVVPTQFLYEQMAQLIYTTLVPSAKH